MKKPSKSYPRIVRSGSAKVSVRRYQNKGHTYYRIEWWIGGKRRTEQHKDEADALREAATKAAQIARGDVDSAQLRGTDRLIYGRAVEFVRPLGISLDLAAAEYAEARQVLGSVPVLEAAKFWRLHHPAGSKSLTVRQVVDEFLEERATAGVRARTLSDYRSRLNRFAEAFQCPMSSVSSDAFDRWMASVAKSAVSHNNFRRVCGTLFAFAHKRNYLPSQTNPIAAIRARKVARSEIEAFTPKELAALLNTAGVDLLPTLLLGAFAGLRVAEAQRLRWDQIHWEEGHIVVEASGAKTARRRTVPICDALRDWLLPISKKSGPLWPGSVWDHSKLQRRLSTEAGIPWKDNGLRHAWISYRLAQIQNENQVALEAGNSPAMIHRHYKALVTQREADRWFGLRPDNQQGRLIAMTTTP